MTTDVAELLAATAALAGEERAVRVSFGVPRDIAVAAVLANQLAFYYLPAIPGWFATRHLIAHDYL